MDLDFIMNFSNRTTIFYDSLRGLISVVIFTPMSSKHLKGMALVVGNVDFVLKIILKMLLLTDY